MPIALQPVMPVGMQHLREIPCQLSCNHSCQRACNVTDDIPSEYRLSAVRFGHTQYIEKESFAKTLNWLKGIHRKLHPPSNELFRLKTDKLWGRKRPIRGLGRMKRIRIK